MIPENPFTKPRTQKSLVGSVLLYICILSQICVPLRMSFHLIERAMKRDGLVFLIKKKPNELVGAAIQA
jgi:hypothetical protein